MENLTTLQRVKNYAKFHKMKFEDIHDNIFVLSEIVKRDRWTIKFKKDTVKLRNFESFILLPDNDIVMLGSLGKSNIESKFLLTAPVIKEIRERYKS